MSWYVATAHGGLERFRTHAPAVAAAPSWLVAWFRPFMGGAIRGETGMHVKRDQQSAHSTWVRVSVAGLLAGAVLLLFRSFAPGDTATTTTASRVVISLASGLLYVAILAPLALRLTTGLWPRLGAVFLTLYVTGTLTDLLEAYFYTSVLTPFSLAAALVFLALPALVIALLVVLIVRPSSVVSEPHGLPRVKDTEHRPLADWAWRVLIAGVLYVPIYYAFGA